MRTAVLPLHLDKVSSPAAQAPEGAFGFAASAMPLCLISDKQITPPPLTTQ